MNCGIKENSFRPRKNWIEWALDPANCPSEFCNEFRKVTANTDNYLASYPDFEEYEFYRHMLWYFKRSNQYWGRSNTVWERADNLLEAVINRKSRLDSLSSLAQSQVLEYHATNVYKLMVGDVEEQVTARIIFDAHFTIKSIE